MLLRVCLPGPWENRWEFGILVFVAAQGIPPIPGHFRITNDIVMRNLGYVWHLSMLVGTLGRVALVPCILPILWVTIFLLLAIVCLGCVKFLLEIILRYILEPLCSSLAVIDHIIHGTSFLGERIGENWACGEQSNISGNAATSMMTLGPSKQLLLLGIDIWSSGFQRIFAWYKIREVGFQELSFFSIVSVSFTLAAFDPGYMTRWLFAVRDAFGLVWHDTLFRWIL